MLLSIHGGPFAQYGWTLFDETQVYVSAGYAVVQCNPRGSSGYGSAHGRAIRGGFGELDAADVLAFLDAALEDPRLDAEPGRDHGRLVRRLPDHAAHRPHDPVRRRHQRAGVPRPGELRRVVRHRLELPRPVPGHRPGAASPRRARWPARRAITTPTLVIHSEEDWRCPLEQGARLYVELKRRGVPSELLLFPGEGHELSRSGRPRHRLARLEHVLRWWARWLPTARQPGRDVDVLAEAEPVTDGLARGEPAASP